MNPTEFRSQVDRLTSTYGPKSYPTERTSLLWEEFKSISVLEFASVVSQVIAENAMAPMLPKFRELFSARRERQVSQDKERYKQDTHEMTSTLGEWIVKSIDGGNAKDVDGFVKLFGMNWVDSLYKKTKEAQCP